MHGHGPTQGASEAAGNVRRRRVHRIGAGASPTWWPGMAALPPPPPPARRHLWRAINRWLTADLGGRPPASSIPLHCNAQHVKSNHSTDRIINSNQFNHSEAADAITTHRVDRYSRSDIRVRFRSRQLKLHPSLHAMDKITAGVAVRVGSLQGRHRARLAARTPAAGRWRWGGGAADASRNRRRLASDHHQLVQGHVAGEQVGEAAQGALHLQERQLVIG